MKITFTFIYLLAIFTSFAQPSWTPLGGIPESGARYDDVFFLDTDLGWAADGPGGMVYKTQDGGQTWTLQATFNNQYLRNIEFLNPNVGFLGTLSNQFYKTINGGLTWTSVSNIPGPVEAVCGLDAVNNTIFGCGAYFTPAYFFKSNNNGFTWQFFDMSAYADALVELLFVNELTGFAAGSNPAGAVILKTVNGGITWEEIYNSGIPGEYVWKLQILFSNPNIIFGSVESITPLDGKLLKSTNGGVSWVSKNVPDTDIQAVGFISPTHGWMGGHHTGFLETFDAGDTWIDTGLGASLNRIQIFDSNLAYCSGATIYKFSDQSLTIQENTPLVQYNAVAIDIVPNPITTSLEFKIDFSRPNHMLIRLFNSEGKLLEILKKETITEAKSNRYTFPFKYPEGLYYVNFHSDSGVVTKKVIRKRE